MTTQTRPTEPPATPAEIAAAQEFIWRTDTRQAARDAGIAAEDVERATFWAWRLRRDHIKSDRARVAEQEHEWRWESE